VLIKIFSLSCALDKILHFIDGLTNIYAYLLFVSTYKLGHKALLIYKLGHNVIYIEDWDVLQRSSGIASGYSSGVLFLFIFVSNKSDIR